MDNINKWGEGERMTIMSKNSKILRYNQKTLRVEVNYVLIQVHHPNEINNKTSEWNYTIDQMDLALTS